jgi:phage terminase large subunit-like protein
VIFIITTAGFNRNGPCYQLRKVVCDILEGKKKDDSLFGLIFSLDEGDNWEDETTWIKANPSIGLTPTWEAMRSQYVKAKNEGETARINFLTKNLNIWTTVSQVWLKDEDWMKNAAPILPDDLRGRDCFAGLDLASVRDITALVLFFPARSADEKHIVIPYFWIPEDGAEQRSRDDGVPYLQWIADGVIEATPGNVTDYAWVKSRILDLCELYGPQSIAYDRFNASQLVIELQDEGLKMEPFGQGFVSMSAPTRQIEKMTLSRELNHGGNEVLRWMCGNVTLKIDPAGNVKMDKGRSQEKIDGMVALAMAIGEWMTGVKVGPSKYESDEMMIL